YYRALTDYQQFFEFAPDLLACDLHPEYSSTRSARTEAGKKSLPLIATQHHHAHIAACMVDNAVALDAPPVLGVALDGFGYGENGTIWGGEFMLADYCGYRRLASFKPVAMIGGDAAVRQPWRSTYAHLVAAIGWADFASHYADIELYRFLEAKPRTL